MAALTTGVEEMLYISVTLSGFTKVPSQVRKSGVFVATLSLVLGVADEREGR